MSKKKLRLPERTVDHLLDKLKSTAKVYDSGTGLVVKWQDVERILNKVKERKVDEQT